jgi:hypothetical protein
VIFGLRGRNVQSDPKQCRKRNIPKSANDAAGNEVTFLSICGMALPAFDDRRSHAISRQ